MCPDAHRHPIVMTRGTTDTVSIAVGMARFRHGQESPSIPRIPSQEFTEIVQTPHHKLHSNPRVVAVQPIRGIGTVSISLILDRAQVGQGPRRLVSHHQEQQPRSLPSWGKLQDGRHQVAVGPAVQRHANIPLHFIGPSTFHQALPNIEVQSDAAYLRQGSDNRRSGHENSIFHTTPAVRRLRPPARQPPANGWLSSHPCRSETWDGLGAARHLWCGGGTTSPPRYLSTVNSVRTTFDTAAAAGPPPRMFALLA